MTPVAKLTGIHDIELLKKWLEFEGGQLTALSATHYHELLHDFANYGAAGLELSPLLPGLVSLGLALAGAGLAWQLYNVADPEEHTDRLGSVKTLLYNNYYQDEYQVWLANDVVRPLARGADKFDQGIVDGVVNGISSVSLFAGSRTRRVQTGVVSNYAALLTIGLTLLLLALGVAGGWFV
jgi:NADH-quinone oxidoreductase subunit L